MGFRLATVEDRAVLVHDGAFFDVAGLSGGALGADPMDAIAAHGELHQLAQRIGDAQPTGQIENVEVGPPVPRPRNCFAIGLNYHSHVAEADMTVPEVPLVFTKFPSCIVGPTAPVELRTETGDYEAELVVVLGSAGRDIPASDAWDHIAGVTVGQDISDRALQFAAKPPHFDLGKSRDTYGPIGPVLVSPDLLPDRDAIPITCDINGERRQGSDTSNLIFDVPALIAYISSIITLAPGDVIFTGTPEGIGALQGKYLKPGDTISTSMEGIGTMENHCL